MPNAPIPFAQSQMSGLEELGGASPARINWLPEASGALRTRPGCSTWSTFPSSPGSTTSVIGIYPWGDVLVYVTSDRYLWALAAAGTVTALSSSDTTTQLAGSKRPTFFNGRSQGSDMLVIAGGGAIQKWTGTGLSARVDGTYDPLPATHVVGMAQRLFADVYGPSGQIQASGQTNGGADYEQWDTSVSGAEPNTTGGAVAFEAEARPDAVVAVKASLNELFAFGKTTVQVYVPDGGTTAGVPNVVSLTRTLGIGCAAPYSIIDLDDSFAWLDHMRRLVISNGRATEVISAPGMSKTIEAIEDISDMWGFRARIGPFDLLVWLCPTDQRGFCFDLNSKSWSEWRSFDLTTANWTTPYIRAYAYWPEQNTHVVGLSDGTLAKLDMDSGSEGSNPISADVTTGFVDRDSSLRKHCEAVRFQFRRGQWTSSPPVVQASYRDDLGGYQGAINMSLGTEGDYDPVMSRRSLGVYRQRQWKLRVTTTSSVALSGAQETFIPLES